MRKATDKLVCLLDGGMGQELVLRAKALGLPIHPLWSAKVLIDKPDLVRQLHLEFLQAGAHVITVSSYSLSSFRLDHYGLASRQEELQRTAVQLANEARDEFLSSGGCGDGRPAPKVAACLSPTASYMPGAAGEDAAALEETYARTAEMQAHGVDLFLCETMGSLHEASCAVRGARRFGKPVWCGLSVSDDLTLPPQLRNGQLLKPVVPEICDIGADAVLLNCSTPEAIDAAMSELITGCKDKKVPAGAYPNAFKSVQNLVADSLHERSVDKVEARDDVSDSQFADLSLRWAQQGATILGGCCEVLPPKIKALRDRLEEQGYSFTNQLN